MIAFSVAGSLVTGGCVGYFIAAIRASRRLDAMRAESERSKIALEMMQQRHLETSMQVEAAQERLTQMDELVSALRTEATHFKTSLQNTQQQRAEDAETLQDMRDQLKDAQTALNQACSEAERYKTALQSELEHRATEASRIKEIQEKHFAQFSTLADKILQDNTQRLSTNNEESMNGILKPLREQLERLGKAVQDTNTASAERKASLETVLKGMMEKTECLSKDAENLALALKGDSKKQGDWGEMVLERMLEESGLRKGEEYYVQSNYKTEEGSNVRPDVVIRFPDKRCIVIDSKVSLTAYTQYMAAEHEEERFSYLNAHVASVRKHIDELSGKDYASVVEDTISYVLMFMPNEASYMAAVQAAPSLPMDAYKRKIILISPTNLLMALQLAYNLWQKEIQNQNVAAIFERATKLYDKLANVQESFESVGKALTSAQSSYESALNQFCNGRGNFAGQVQKLLKMGISPRKQLQVQMDDEES